MPMTKQDYIQTQPITKAALLTLCNLGTEEGTSRYFAGSTWHKLTVSCKILDLWEVQFHHFWQDTCFFI